MKIYAIVGSHLWKSPLKRIFPNQSVQLQQLLRCLHNISQRYWKTRSNLTELLTTYFINLPINWSAEYGEIISIQRAAVATARGGARRAREQGRSTGQTRRWGFWIFESLVLGLLKVPGCALTVSKPCKTLLPRWVCSWRRWFLTTGSRSLPPWPGFSPQPSSPSFSGFSSSSSSWATMRTGTGTGRADNVEILLNTVARTCI